MAHKHNRRRIRHRNRRTKYEQNQSLVHEWAFPLKPGPEYWRVFAAALQDSSTPGVQVKQPVENTAKNWLGTYLRNNDRYTRLYRPTDGSTLPQRWQQQHQAPYCTEEQYYMRKFGGEPGEGSALSDKMQAMFDSMDWME